MQRRLLFVLVAVGACTSRDAAPRESPAAAPRASGTAKAVPQLPPRAAADSLIATYLDRIAERDHFGSADFEGMRALNGPCIEEMYGDAESSYWLARGRLLGYDKQVKDTLYSRLEITTVAEQVPTTDRQLISEVRARIKTDTVAMRLVPDSTRKRWQICGFLSTGFDFGGYGRPSNTKYPPNITRADLLRQVDSIRTSCVDFSGDYVTAYEDGRGWVSIRQDHCRSVVLIRRVAGIGGEHADTATYPLDAPLPIRGGVIAAEVLGDTLRLTTKSIKAADTVVVGIQEWRRHINGDLCFTLPTEGKRANFYIAARYEGAGENDAANRSEVPLEGCGRPQR